MFLTPELAAQTRESTLNNLLGLSSTWFSASQRLTDLYSAASRDAVTGWTARRLPAPPHHGQ